MTSRAQRPKRLRHDRESRRTHRKQKENIYDKKKNFSVHEFYLSLTYNYRGSC